MGVFAAFAAPSVVAAFVAAVDLHHGLFCAPDLTIRFEGRGAAIRGGGL